MGCPPLHPGAGPAVPWVPGPPRRGSTSPQPMPALTVTTNVSLTKEQKHTFLKPTGPLEGGGRGGGRMGPQKVGLQVPLDFA